MKFTLDTGQGILVHAYQSGKITLKVPTNNPAKPYREESHESSLILGHSDTPENWPIACIDELAEQHFESVWQVNPDIVLLGTGQKLVFPDIEIRQGFAIKGVGFEVMDTAAACRTYNVLVSEGRNVMALLVVE